MAKAVCFFSSRRRHTRCALVTGVQTCALPICATASSNPVQPDGFFTRSLGDADPAIAAGVAHELQRQQDQIELIASENIVSQAVLEAQGSTFTNKYAEG